MIFYIFVISWFLVGFFTLLYIWIDDMRGQEFDPYYFEQEGAIFISLLMIVLGYISPIICFLIYISEYDKKPFTKLIYKLCNIGIKKKEENEEGEE